MNKITKQRGPWLLRSEVRDGGRPRPIVIEVDPDELTLRQKGRRRRYRLPWEAVYVMAVRAEVERVRKEKVLKRKAVNP